MLKDVVDNIAKPGATSIQAASSISCNDVIATAFVENDMLHIPQFNGAGMYYLQIPGSLIRQLMKEGSEE